MIELGPTIEQWAPHATSKYFLDEFVWSHLVTNGVRDQLSHAYGTTGAPELHMLVVDALAQGQDIWHSYVYRARWTIWRFKQIPNLPARQVVA